MGREHQREAVTILWGGREKLIVLITQLVKKGMAAQIHHTSWHASNETLQKYWRSTNKASEDNVSNRIINQGQVYIVRLTFNFQVSIRSLNHSHGCICQVD